MNGNDYNYIFKHPTDEYKANLAPIKEYINLATKAISAYYSIPVEKANSIAKHIAKQHFKNPIVKYRYRDDNGDTCTKEDTLTDYIKEVILNKEILAPSGTTYINPKIKKSLHAEYLGINIAKRNVYKKNAFIAKQTDDTDKFKYNNVMQATVKILNNSLSGAYASPSTIFYNPSAHYTLTSITRSVASIGNAITESIVSGNKLFISRELMFNYIVTVSEKTDLSSIEIVINRYNLHIPTPQEVLDSLLRSSDKYWKDKEFNAYILNYLFKLTGVQRAAIVYVNDLYHIRMHNDAFVKDMLGQMSKKVTTGSNDYLSDIKNSPDGVSVLANHIWADEIRGMSVVYDKLEDQDLLCGIASTCKNITELLVRHRLFFRVFFTTNLLPISIANIRSMLRETIVLSDTDSTCGAYDEWVTWFFGGNNFTATGIGLAASVMTIATQAMDHNIKVFAKNMNIASESVDLLRMKNEYYWKTFTAANVSKHYYADTYIKEGNVFKESELELKGVHLIASTIDETLSNRGNAIMKEINSVVESGGLVDVYKYVKEVADLERQLLSIIESGNINIYKMIQIKNFKSYKKDIKEQTPYFNHMLWTDVFMDEYGDPGEPTYNAIMIPTVMHTKKTMSDYIATIENESIRNKLTEFMTKYNKESLGSFRPPMSVVGGPTGIPKEMLAAVDKRRLVLTNLNMFYIILETIGIYRKESLLFSEMGY